MSKDSRTKQTDEVRRFTRRGVARCVLENAHNESYFENRPIADEFRRSYSRKKLNYWATESNPASTGKFVFGMQTPSNPKAALWPK